MPSREHNPVNGENLSNALKVTSAAVALCALALGGCANSTHTASAKLGAAATPSSTSAAAASSTASASASAATVASTSTSSTPATSHSTTAKKAPAPTASASATTTRKVSRDQARPSVTTRVVTSTKAIAFSTVTRKDSSLAKGTTKVTQRGAAGTATVSIRQSLVGGKVVKSQVISTSVSKRPTTKIVVVGTKVAKKAAAASTATTSSPTASASTGGLDLRRAAMWDRIASCESHNVWSTNTGNGYFGGLQFTQQTWAGYGGLKFASRADLASRAQQITIANKIADDMGGLSAWGCAGAA